MIHILLRKNQANSILKCHTKWIRKKKKNTSFNINNKLIFIDGFPFLSFSLDSLVENLNKDDFKYLSQEFDSKVFDLVSL